MSQSYVHIINKYDKEEAKTGGGLHFPTDIKV